MKQTLFGMALLGLACSSANAALVSASGGLAYYDTGTNLTWVADANLAETSGYDADGRMTWTQSVGRIASLNAQNAGLGYLGTNTWRLPTVTDTGSSGCNFTFNGTDCGFNVDLATSEMAKMFASTLGNTAGFNTSGIQQPCYSASPNYCMGNVGSFSNIQAEYYWSGTTHAPNASDAWYFSFANGNQSVQPKTVILYAWAVSSGNPLGAPVPIPPAVWLFGSALGVMGWMRRKIPR